MQIEYVRENLATSRVQSLNIIPSVRETTAAVAAAAAAATAAAVAAAAAVAVAVAGAGAVEALAVAVVRRTSSFASPIMI